MTRSPQLLTATDFTDLELRDRMLARDGIAWREFHRRYDRLVFRCIHKVVGRFRSVVQGPDGNLYIAVDQGDIYQFKPN